MDSTEDKMEEIKRGKLTARLYELGGPYPHLEEFRDPNLELIKLHLSRPFHSVSVMIEHYISQDSFNVKSKDFTFMYPNSETDTLDIDSIYMDISEPITDADWEVANRMVDKIYGLNSQLWGNDIDGELWSIERLTIPKIGEFQYFTVVRKHLDDSVFKEACLKIFETSGQDFSFYYQ